MNGFSLGAELAVVAVAAAAIGVLLSIRTSRRAAARRALEAARVPVGAAVLRRDGYRAMVARLSDAMNEAAPR